MRCPGVRLAVCLTGGGARATGAGVVISTGLRGTAWADDAQAPGSSACAQFPGGVRDDAPPRALIRPRRACDGYSTSRTTSFDHGGHCRAHRRRPSVSSTALAGFYGGWRDGNGGFKPLSLSVSVWAPRGLNCPGRPQLAGISSVARMVCRYPGCKRSFAELWRLKVHYRCVGGRARDTSHLGTPFP
jgi:hypothetical protein